MSHVPVRHLADANLNKCMLCMQKKELKVREISSVLFIAFAIAFNLVKVFIA